MYNSLHGHNESKTMEDDELEGFEGFEGYADDDDHQPDEQQEWYDYDPDC